MRYIELLRLLSEKKRRKERFLGENQVSLKGWRQRHATWKQDGERLLYKGKEFSAGTVERTGREVSERTISCWEKGRLPGPDDIIREDS